MPAIRRRAVVISLLGAALVGPFAGGAEAEPITLTEETAVNPSGGPFDSGLVVQQTSNSSTTPGTITISQYLYATTTSSSIAQYINAQFSAEGFNGIIIYSGQTDPIFTSVTLTSQDASYGNSNYPGPFTASDVSFNAHEIALNFSDIATVGTFNLSFTTASIVPEPASIALAILGGLGGLLASRLKIGSRVSPRIGSLAVEIR